MAIKSIDKAKKDVLVEGLRYAMENIEMSETSKSIIEYTITGFEENERNVTKKDLKDTIEGLEIETGINFLDDIINTVIEPEVKKDEEPQPEAEDKTKKILPTKKDTPKVDNSVKQTSKSKESTLKSTTQYLESFPETLVSTKLEGATIKLRTDIKTIEDVKKAYDNREDIVIATYWTKKLLKQFDTGYDPMNINPNRPTEFEHDLDLVEITYANELVVTGVSLYSYVPQILLPKDFAQDENNMRYCNGCEFQIYEVLESEQE